MGGKFSYISIFSTIFMELDNILNIDWAMFTDFRTLRSALDSKSISVFSLIRGPLKFNAWLLGLALFLILSARAKLLNRRESIISRIQELKGRAAQASVA